MRSIQRFPVLVTVATLACGLWSAPVSAQGIGIGGRLAWVRPDTSGAEAVRFTGGQIRLLAPRVGVELSMDRAKSLELLGQEVTETPVQASLLLRTGGRSLSPYLLAGPGWYRRSVAPVGGGEAVQTTEFGWHAGAGLELRPARRFGLHGDYRYTFLDFGDDDGDAGGLIGRFLPGHRGSMWTLGATLYF